MTQQEDDLEDVRKLINAVGQRNTPDEIDLHALDRDLRRTISRIRSDITLDLDRTQDEKHFKALARHADGVIAALASGPLPYRKIPDSYSMISKERILAQMQLLSEWAKLEGSRKPKNLRRYANSLTTIVGCCIGPLYERHFRRKPATSGNNTDQPGGPFIRFALYVLAECGMPAKASAVRSALKESRKYYQYDVSTGTLTTLRNPLNPRRRGAQRRDRTYTPRTPSQRA
jgi:hypothetical protein